MSLAQRCAASFNTNDKRRGEVYFYSRRVKIIRQEQDFIEAQVRGSQRYEVEFRVDDDESENLYAWCSCPRFEDGFLCKHLWATLLAIDADGRGDPSPGFHSLRVIQDDDLFLDEEFEDNARSEDDDISFEHSKSLTSSQVSSAIHRIPKSPLSLSWKNDLEKFKHSWAYATGPSSTFSSKNTELYYLISFEDCRRNGKLRIDLAECKVGKNGQKKRIKRFNTYGHEVRNLLPRLIHREDREILELCTGVQGQESLYYPGERQRLSSFFIGKGMFPVLLPKLCATGRFGWVRNSDSVPDDIQVLF
jgi:hypothetical protein